MAATVVSVVIFLCGVLVGRGVRVERGGVAESTPIAGTDPTPQPARASAAHAASAEPSGQGFAVQIAALNIRSEADAIVKRLSSKGYAAYVISPLDGTPAVYRVRVGKFTTRREAETVAAKLQKEE